MNTSLPTLRVCTADGHRVARDGLVITFFMHRSHGEVAPALWRALRIYRQAILPSTLGWYSDDTGELQPLDAAGWEATREEVLARRWPEACRVNLEEHADSVGGYTFEYRGGWLDDTRFMDDEDPSCGVTFTLPTEYLLEHGPSHVRSLALELSRELSLSFGYASFALISPHASWYSARRAVRALRDRYLGLDVYRLEETCRSIGTQARGAYWLTFLGPPLLGRLGGLEHLRGQLSFPDVTLHTLPPLEGARGLVTLGEWPQALDTERGECPSPSLLALARLLSPFLHEERSNGFTLMGDLDDMRRWSRRFCP